MKALIERLISEGLSSLRADYPQMGESIEYVIERTKHKSHGDFSSNIALVLSKPLKMTPRALAETLKARLCSHPLIERTEIAGPGFLNFFFKKEVLYQTVLEILNAKDQFGSSAVGHDQKVLIEYVSANPTGPLHVGHGRGAALGASLSNLLAFAGFSVTREYYVNDAGRQMDILAVSVWLRYLSLCHEEIVFPSNAYRGEYVLEMAEAILKTKGTQYLYSWALFAKDLPKDEPEGGDKEQYIDAVIAHFKQVMGESVFAYFHHTALTVVLDDIRQDLQAFGVEYDAWFSEASLVKEGAVQQAIEALKEAGHTYLQAGALWFRATAFGDEKDRVLIRANGQFTYFASDVAYHWHKYQRGYDKVIDLFGADHHGYVSRLKAAMAALGHDETALTVLLVQFAILYREGQRVQMSTRSGSFVTLRELREEVGQDAARFFYVMRKPDQHMDFDLDLAKSKSNENPVYYVQYAYARISSIFRQLNERGLSWMPAQDCAALSQLGDAHEEGLMETLASFPDCIVASALAYEPHLIAYYLKDLATKLHSYYNAVPLICDDEALRSARLSLLQSVRQVLKNGMKILGISTPESM